jgi:Peptidase family M1 domain
MMIKNSILFLSALFFLQNTNAQYWQQRVKYAMDINMNVETNRFTGKQKLEYWNNSPDTLTRVFYHLYFNAFQPNSMMDTRSRRQGTIQVGRGQDWDPRVKDRIINLKPDEIGYQKILSLKMNGKAQQYNMLETILEVNLDKPILPKTKVVFDMDFEAQVPLQVRRSGRDNPTSKVRYSMSQWYPKLCEYDKEGWHPTPYIAREFYGVWGDFDVKITIDKKYILGASGYLQNANQIGYGYETPGYKVAQSASDKLTWHFTAPNVHDFMWAADPEFIHKTRKVKDSLTLHLLYKPTNVAAAQWEKILDDAEKALPFIEKTFGAYPYKHYSFIHGGDGGMEYPMATLLITPGAWLHEWLHAWYYGMLGTNESIYSWMDEGFTSYADDRVSAFLENNTGFAYKGSYDGYYNYVKSGKEEALTTHSDHFNTNYAFGQSSYSKGAVFMEQLGYIMGAETRDKFLLRYYNQWRFKHPDVNDMLRVAEKTSGMELDWYKEYFVNSARTIDYAVDSLWEEGGKTKIRLRRLGMMPMPIDCMLTFRDGTSEMHYIPMYLMFGQKKNENKEVPFIVYDAWKWTHETYIIETKKSLAELAFAEIDPSLRMADADRKNNKLEIPKFK